MEVGRQCASDGAGPQIRDYTGCIFFICVNLQFRSAPPAAAPPPRSLRGRAHAGGLADWMGAGRGSNLSAIEIFLKERVIFIHEKASGHSPPPASGTVARRGRDV